MLTFGQKLFCFRKNRRFADAHRSRMNQAELYQRARLYEDAPTKTRKGLAFPLSKGSQSSQAKTIRDWEAGAVDPTQQQVEFLEMALELPQGMLLRYFATEAEIEEAIRNECPGTLRSEYSVEQLVRLRKADAPRASTARTSHIPDHIDGLRITLNRPASTRNREVIDKLSDFIFADAVDQFSVCCIAGPSGSGKSHLLSDWYFAIRAEPQRPRIIVIDASHLNEQELKDEVLQRLCGQRCETGAEILGVAVEAALPAIVVIDGLRDRSPHRSGRKVELGELQTATLMLVQLLERAGARHSLVLLVEDDKSQEDPLAIERKLQAHSRYLPIRLSSLNTEQAVDFVLGELGQRDGAERAHPGSGFRRIAIEDVRKICRRSDKMPITLQAISALIGQCATDSEFDDFVVSGRSGDRRDEHFGPWFRGYIDKLEESYTSQRSHPTALLRLLALMPGPVPKPWLGLLFQQVRVGRLADGVDDILGSFSSPFIIEDRNEYDLHDLARNEVLLDISTRLNTLTDANVTFDEVLAIHLGMANVCWQIVQSQPRREVLTNAHVRALEHLVFHLMRFRDLRARRTPGDAVPVAEQCTDSSARAARVYDGTASALEITEHCWRDIVVPYVVHRTHKFTNLLAQFEAKLRLLKYFFPDQRIENKIPFLSRHEADEILKEIAFVASHLGRSSTAHLAAKRATEHLALDEAVTELYLFQGWASWCSLPEAKEKWWLTHFEAICHHALIMLRRSSHALQVRGLVDVYDSFFKRVTEGWGLDEDVRKRGLAVAARRHFARMAQILLYQGELVPALGYFKRAESIDQHYGRPYLQGEAGRRHMQALSREKPASTDAKDYAGAILQFNKENDLARARSHGVLSMDQLAWLQAEAALLRIKGEFEQAQAVLRTATNHQSFTSGTASYTTRADLELEKFKLATILGECGDERDLTQLVDDLADHHHHQLAYDAMLLRAECFRTDRNLDDLDVVQTRLEAESWLSVVR